MKNSSIIRFGIIALVMMSLVGCQSPPTPTLQQIPSPLVTTLTPWVTQTPKPTITHSPSATPGSTLGVSPEMLKGLRIRFWFSGHSEMVSMIENLEAEFNATNQWGIWLDATSYPSYADLIDRVETSSIATEAPEIILTYPDQAQLLQKMGAEIINLKGYIQDPIWGYSDPDLSDFSPNHWVQNGSSDGYLGLPALGSTQVLFYNLTWAQELGYSEPPVSPEDFQNQSCAAYAAILADGSVENDGTGGWLIEYDPGVLSSWISAFGGDIQPEMDGTYQFNITESVDAFTYLKQGFNNGCFWIGRKPDPFGYFAERNSLFIAARLQDSGILQSSLDAVGNMDRWTALPFPGIEGDPVILYSGLSYHLLESDPQKQLAAWIFTKWINDTQNLARLGQASQMIPARQSSLQFLEAAGFPTVEWQSILPRVDQAAQEPIDSSWGRVRTILQDAYRQLFLSNVTFDQIPDILIELDETIQDVIRESP